jgi:hypothetical protein
MINPVHNLEYYVTIYPVVWNTKPAAQVFLQATIILHQYVIVCLCTVVKDLFGSFSNNDFNKTTVLVSPSSCQVQEVFYSPQHSPLLWVDISTRTLKS